ncbi:uncharacterized protein LOC128854773 [Anastrepha ludens]|uniref:uncharacterized protein LOC128854773 n=1 Tax=Anastrepha ludens TaxID=28586 RepID=UPI0023AED1F2|nr:uncharacterized protein LOC128854773 [Anastrepha ludens]
MNKNKGKRKGLPKLKTILANPIKEKCPALDEGELQELGQLLSESISCSGLNPQQFATSVHIRLGLESSLRAINNLKCSCVLISLTIQPRFLIGLIVRNVEAKNTGIPVYVQSQLEEFTKSVFGVRALALCLPTVEEMRVNKLDEKLLQWVGSRTKPVKPKASRVMPKIIKNKKPTVSIKEAPAIELQKTAVENVNEQWEGDFISFSETREVDKADPIKDEQQLTEALSKVVENVEKQAVRAVNCITATTTTTEVKMDVAEDVSHAVEKCYDDKSCSDSDDFLPEIYQPLTVHKIKPNPQKKPKKKRKKNNKQKKN